MFKVGDIVKVVNISQGNLTDSQYYFLLYGKKKNIINGILGIDDIFIQRKKMFKILNVSKNGIDIGYRDFFGEICYYNVDRFVLIESKEEKKDEFQRIIEIKGIEKYNPSDTKKLISYQKIDNIYIFYNYSYEFCKLFYFDELETFKIIFNDKYFDQQHMYDDIYDAVESISSLVKNYEFKIGAKVIVKDSTKGIISSMKSFNGNGKIGIKYNPSDKTHFESHKLVRVYFKEEVKESYLMNYKKFIQ